MPNFKLFFVFNMDCGSRVFMGYFVFLKLYARNDEKGNYFKLDKNGRQCLYKKQSIDKYFIFNVYFYYIQFLI